MLIKNEQQQKTDSFFRSVEENNQQVKEGLRQYKDTVLIGKEHDPTNILQRMGKFLSASELITKLESLSYYVKIEKHPSKHNMWVVYSMRGDAKKYVCAFEDGLVPERTLMNTRTIEDVDPSTLNPSWKPGKYDAPIKDFNGILQIDESQPRPGLIKYTIPWHIEKMGYRTILLRLMDAGIITKAKVEEVFGNDNTPEWAAKTGARDKNLARI